MQYWSAVEILKQLSGELGIPVQSTVVSADNVQGSQLLAALNSAGNELVSYYPWQQFSESFTFDTVVDQDTYPLPDDWAYFIDQTQWDHTNHWPLLGPKSPQEWAYIKGSLVAPLPRLRYRVRDNLFHIYPKPADPGFTPLTLSMEYIRGTWVQPATGGPSSMVTQDGDTCLFNPWLLIKYTKLKFYQLKQFDTKAVSADFIRVFDSLTGKDSGAPVLNLVQRPTPQFVGYWSVPDGSWNVGG
jgi:hypothetical protein